MTEKKRGRPSKFTQELAARICERLSAGETLRAVCRDEEMPTHSAVLGWAAKDDGFSDQYARAREAGYLQMAEELLEIADDGTNDYVERVRENGTKHVVFDGEHVQRSRLRLDTRKWLLSKALPKIYGDKLEIEATHRHDASNLTDDELADIIASRRRERVVATKDDKKQLH